MSHLVNEQCHCPKCNKWSNAVHRNCPANGRIQVDLNSGQEYCTGCGKTWSAEVASFYCSCGHVEPTKFQDAAVGAAVAETYVVTDGEQVFLITTSDIFEEATRYFTNIRGSA